MFYLDFDQFPRKKKQSGFISHIQEYMAKCKRQTAMHHSEPTLAQKFCRPILSVLEAQACTGREQLSAMQKEQLERSKQIADDLGMTFNTITLGSMMPSSEKMHAHFSCYMNRLL